MYNPFKDLPASREVHSNPCLRRYAGNPILTAKDVPYAADYVFNAGVAYFKGKYFIAPRVDVRNRHWEEGAPQMCDIGTGLGTSDDGIHFDIMPEKIRVHYQGELLPWINDSRLTVLEDNLYVSFVCENQHCERPGIARWRGTGTDFDAVCLGVPQQRNMILCPFKKDGLYMRLERPANQYHEPFSIWYSLSPDLEFWGKSELLLGCEDVNFANVKIGGGAPMLETEKGYLLIFHAVDGDPKRAKKVAAGFMWDKRYTCGAALFAKDDPAKLIAITPEPLLVAEAPYEVDCPELWVENTIFPCGAVPTQDGKTLRIWYGAGDYSTNLAEIDFADLWKSMKPCERMAEKAIVPFMLNEWKNYSKYKK